MGNKKFYIPFTVLFVLYVVAELNKPKPIDWSVTLTQKDKIPFGSWVLFNQLKDVFPNAGVRSYQSSLLNIDDEQPAANSVLLIVTETFDPSETELKTLRLFVTGGHPVLIAASNFGKRVGKQFNLKTTQRPVIVGNDSSELLLTNPTLQAGNHYRFANNTVSEYFSKIDTARSTVLGTDKNLQPNFVRYALGQSYLYFHAAPLSFSNYFMLHKNNAKYTAACLSYLPANTAMVYWDEYFKPGGNFSATPLRYFLSNIALLWALRISLAALLLYVLFQTKRRQRIIPVLEPLKNTSLQFVQTVSSVYFNQKDNGGIASKKIAYFLEFIRNRFYLKTSETDSEFIDNLGKKSGVAKPEIEKLVTLINYIQSGQPVSDSLLLKLEARMSAFYNQV